MKYSAVLFDMDGTVLDTLGDLTDSVNHTLRLFSMPERSADEVASFLGNGAARLIASSVPSGTDAALEREVLTHYSQWYDEHCQIKTAPYAGIISLMESVRQAGAKLALISNKQDSAVKALAARHFPGLLELAIGESATVRRKPNPDAVNAAIVSLGVAHEECIYVGDTEVDLETAANAGIDCAAVSWGFRSRRFLEESGARLIFDSPETLARYLLS